SLRGGEWSQRVDDRRPLVPRHVEGCPHPLRERRVGPVDDSRIRVAGLDGSQGCTHVEGGDDLRPDVVPEADRLEVRLRVDARRHGLRTCERQILHLEEVRAADEPLPLEALHLREIGREEDVGRRSGPDLAGEVIRGAEVEDEMVSRGGLVALADLSERVRQARRREDHDLLRHRSPRQEQRESEGDGTNPRIHATHPLPPLARAILRPHNYRTVHPQATRDTAASIDQKRRPRSALQRSWKYVVRGRPRRHAARAAQAVARTSLRTRSGVSGTSPIATPPSALWTSPTKV